MAEYALGDLFEEVVITLDQNSEGDPDPNAPRFRLRERTRSVADKVTALEKQFQELPDDAPDEQATDVMIDLLDALLEPMGDGNNGTRTHAKTVLSKAYKADKIGADRIIGLARFCQQKLDDRLDPTSAPTIGG